MAVYDSHADAFDAHARDGAWNAHYDRPTMLRMLGDVAGLTVLDAGCGPGHYVGELLDRGAAVTGVDESAEMIRIARGRYGDRADLRVHDLTEPLPWLADGSVDRVLMALVVHHLPDVASTLREMRRLLADDGRVLVSTSHPTTDWRRLGGSYFTDARVAETWRLGLRTGYRRAPLEAWAADFAAAGFVIESIVETRPAESMREAFPAEYAELTTEPGFIAFALMKHPGTP